MSAMDANDIDYYKIVILAVYGVGHENAPMCLYMERQIRALLGTDSLKYNFRFYVI